jgi:hypothetical protein
MSRIALWFCFSLFALSAQAQFGINTSFRFNNAPGWSFSNPVNNSVNELPGNNLAFGLDVWIPIKGLRLDFLPELNYARYDAEIVDIGKLEQQMGSLFLNFNLYFLDLKGDCQCPTFSKSGSTLGKGLFLQVSPGYSVLEGKADLFSGARARGRSYAPSLGLGMGLDIGLSDKFTFTPFGGARYYPKARWFGLEEALEVDPSIGNFEVSNDSAIMQIYVGMRLGFRFDKQ